MNILLVLMVISQNVRGNVWTPEVGHYATMAACESDARLIQASIKRQVDASVQDRATRFETRGEEKVSENVEVTHECLDTAAPKPGTADAR